MSGDLHALHPALTAQGMSVMSLFVGVYVEPRTCEEKGGGLTCGGSSNSSGRGWI